MKTKVTLADTVTTSSAALPEPTTLRASRRPLDSSVVGRHPPPSTAAGGMHNTADRAERGKELRNGPLGSDQLAKREEREPNEDMQSEQEQDRADPRLREFGGQR